MDAKLLETMGSDEKGREAVECDGYVMIVDLEIRDLCHQLTLTRTHQMEVLKVYLRVLEALFISF
jgi:hypothetical protein